MKRKRVVIQEFVGLSDMDDDQFWSSIFLEASYGKLPIGFRYDSGCLVYKNSKGVVSNLVLPKSPVDIYIQCKKFMKEQASIYSPIELSNFKFTVDTPLPKEWKDISINNKDGLLADYVDRLIEDKNKRIIILREIKSAISNKQIRRCNIHIDGLYITDIDNVEYRNGNLLIHIANRKPRYSTRKKKTKHKDQWSNVIRRMCRHIDVDDVTTNNTTNTSST